MWRVRVRASVIARLSHQALLSKFEKYFIKTPAVIHKAINFVEVCKKLFEERIPFSSILVPT